MKQWKRDALLILTLILAAGALWFVFRPQSQGTYAVVIHHGREIGRYALSESRSVPIGDEAYNILTISDGEVYISDANCGDHTCIHTGRISLEGERIICLPHELVIEVVGSEQTDIDASTH